VGARDELSIAGNDVIADTPSTALRPISLMPSSRMTCVSAGRHEHIAIEPG
jgi:hypothetical protein